MKNTVLIFLKSFLIIIFFVHPYICKPEKSSEPAKEKYPNELKDFKLYDKYCKGFIWNDEDIKISWPIQRPILNMRDSLYPQFKEINKNDFPKGFSK